MATFKVGDVVYVEGASAILGDVIAINPDKEQGVTIRWRSTVTTETSDELHFAKDDA